MKKTILAIATVLLMGTAYAQTEDQAGDENMIESNVESLVRGSFNFDKSKTRGKDADNDTQLDLVLNYARKFAKQWQWGARVNYKKDTAAAGDEEKYGFQVGLFYNFSENLQESFYVSLFTGLDWDKFYSGGIANDEIWKTTLAVGKRFALARWKVAHLVYSPEIALQTANSTTGSKGSNLEYSHNVQFRFLQFSLFF
jgi:hypothetical protein